MRLGHLQYRPSRVRHGQQSGYMLIICIFLMTALIISALAITASIKEQIKRDHEEEMIHRGVQYVRAIKRYYKKFGRYPATLEALEDTNHMRFLRKRYKDPLTKDGKWVLVRYGQVQFGTQGGGAFTNSGQPGLPNVPGVTSMFGGGGQTQTPSTFGQPSSFGQSSFGQSSFGQSNSGQSAFGQNNPQQQQQSGQHDQSSSGTTGDTSSGNAFGTSTTGSSGNNLGQSATGLIGTGAVGGGAIIGVASMSKQESLRVVADKNHYNDWRFVYDPSFDRGALITGPYDPKKALGKFPGGSQPGQPIGQPAGQQQSGFGNSSFGNQGGSFGSQGGFGQPAQPPTGAAPPNQQ
ncbi:MAG: hypothetical protein ACXVZX_02720 [Terriglobales bacterium]